MEQIDFSHSKLEIARECMLKFKYQYIDHLTGEKDTTATDFGEVCHYIAEHYCGGGKPELLALYHKIVPSKYILVDDYKKRIPIALKNIHDHWIKVLSDNTITSIKKEDPISVEINENIKINGKIDLTIEYNTGRISITDYKTNKSSAFADHKNQLSMYMLLLNKKYNIPYDKMDTNIIYLALNDSDKKGNHILNSGYENISKKYTLDETDVECLLTEIHTIHKQILKNKDRNIWKAKPHFLCKYCKFNNICTEIK